MCQPPVYIWKPGLACFHDMCCWGVYINCVFITIFFSLHIFLWNYLPIGFMFSPLACTCTADIMRRTLLNCRIIYCICRRVMFFSLLNFSVTMRFFLSIYNFILHLFSTFSSSKQQFIVYIPSEWYEINPDIDKDII